VLVINQIYLPICMNIFISFSKELNDCIQHYNNTNTKVVRTLKSKKIKWLTTIYYTKSAISGSIRKEFTSSYVFPQYRVLCISCPEYLSLPNLITGIQFQRSVMCFLYIRLLIYLYYLLFYKLLLKLISRFIDVNYRVSPTMRRMLCRPTSWTCHIHSTISWIIFLRVKYTTPILLRRITRPIWLLTRAYTATGGYTTKKHSKTQQWWRWIFKCSNFLNFIS